MIQKKWLSSIARGLDHDVKSARYMVNNLWVSAQVTGMNGVNPMDGTLRTYSQFRVMLDQAAYLNQTVTRIQLMDSYGQLLVECEESILLDDPSTPQLVYTFHIEVMEG